VLRDIAIKSTIVALFRHIVFATKYMDLRSASNAASCAQTLESIWRSQEREIIDFILIPLDGPLTWGYRNTCDSQLAQV
jgi:hypothetical protein